MDFLYNSKDIMSICGEYRIVDYNLCWGDTSDALSDRVRNYIQKGYILYDTVIVRNNHIYQAVIKIEKV